MNRLDRCRLFVSLTTGGGAIFEAVGIPLSNSQSNSIGGITVSNARFMVATSGASRPTRISSVLRLTTVVLFTLAIVAQGFAAPKNLVAGVGPLSSATKWDGHSAISVIPGASLFPTTSKTTALYVAFTGGTQADISNMVLYQTVSRDPAIRAVTPVTLNGVSNPAINLLDTTICPDQPVSVTAPCIIRLDLLTLQLAPSSDYYLAIYFTSDDTNNAALGLSKPLFATSGLTGFLTSSDETKHVVGDPLSTLFNTGTPFGLIAVMSK